MVFIQRIMTPAISIQLLYVPLYHCKFCSLHELQHHVLTIKMLYPAIYVLLQFFKQSLKLLISVKEIEADVQIQKASHNQTLILWAVWYEFSPNSKVLLC